MLPDRVSNPGPLTYESDALPIVLHGPSEYFGSSDALSTYANFPDTDLIVLVCNYMKEQTKHPKMKSLCMVHFQRGKFEILIIASPFPFSIGSSPMIKNLLPWEKYNH